MAEVVASDVLLLQAASLLVPTLQSGLRLRLYQNFVAVTPSSTFGDLSENTFPGYHPIHLDALFQPPRLIVPGLVLIELPTLQFIPSAASTEQVFGAFADYFSTLLFTLPFDHPIAVAPFVPITTRIAVQVWALATACH